jgi:hypothetical protein
MQIFNYQPGLVPLLMIRPKIPPVKQRHPALLSSNVFFHRQTREQVLQQAIQRADVAHPSYRFASKLSLKSNQTTASNDSFFRHSLNQLFQQAVHTTPLSQPTEMFTSKLFQRLYNIDNQAGLANEPDPQSLEFAESAISYFAKGVAIVAETIARAPLIAGSTQKLSDAKAIPGSCYKTINQQLMLRSFYLFGLLETEKRLYEATNNSTISTLTSALIWGAIK